MSAEELARPDHRVYTDCDLPNLYKNALALAAKNLHNNPHEHTAMNIFRTTPPAVVLGALSLFLLPATQGVGQTTATTDPVGYTALSLPASSDSLISIPFTRPAAFVGAIGSISSNVITVASSPGWTAEQYQYAAGSQSSTYYAIIGPNLATVSGTVTVTNASTAVTATAGLSGIKANDELIVNGLAYNVASVTSDTALVLSRAFTGTSASGQTATYDHSPKEGSYYTVTDNGTNSLTVNLNGDSLSTVTAGTTVSLIPYWTLSTAFPSSAAYDATNNPTGSFVASASAKSRGTQILLPDMVSTGVNLAPPSTFYYLNGAWVYTGTGAAPAVPNDVILLPTSYFIVRNPAASSTFTGTIFTPTGGVYMNRLTAPFDTFASSAQDNAVALPRPVSTTLNDLDLISSGAFTPGTSAKSRGDLLLTYDNTTAAYNKASLLYYWNIGGVWYSSQNGTDVGNTATVSYGTGFTIRKVANSTGATAFWQNTRNY